MSWLGWLIVIVVVIGFFSNLSEKSEKNKQRQKPQKQNKNKNIPDNSRQSSDLNNFRINVEIGSRESQSKNKMPGKWIVPGEVVQVDKYQISGGNFYFGGVLNNYNDYYTESSLVDPTLDVNNKVTDDTGSQMSYWPSYNQISPSSRAAYLKWLASDRDDPETYIGYVFIYFYGLERRLLLEGSTLSRADRATAIVEIKRLREKYSHNRSFAAYSSNLLSHLWALYPDEVEWDEELLVGNRDFTDVLKLQLAKCAVSGDRIPAELALAWLRSHPEVKLKTPARRCKQEFDQLFKKIYEKNCDGGLVVAPNKTRLSISYHVANGSLRGYPVKQLDLPDITRLKSPVNKLLVIADECTVLLEPLSRYLGKEGNARDDISAMAYIPSEISSKVSNKQFNKLKSWINEKIVSNGGIVTTQELLHELGEEAPLKINKKEAEVLSSLVERAGFGMAPDIRYHHAKVELEGKVVLFQSGHGDNFTPSHAFMQVGTILRLGAMVAAIDSHVDQSEVDTLRRMIDHDSKLTPTEKQSLTAYMHWRLNTPTNMNGLKARLEKMTDIEKTAVSHILISVALADGKLDASEIKQLEKLYASLGLDKAMLSSEIHQISTRKVHGAVEGGKEKVYQPEESSSGFTIDKDVLKIHEEETKEVRAVLEGIFADDGMLEEQEEAAEEPTVSLPALDAAYKALYEKLITKEEWNADEVKSMCDDMGLMMSGAIEVINEWSFDLVDGPVIEEGATIYVDTGLAEEIASL